MAVWPLPPTWKAVPSGRSRQGPISIEKLLSTKETGVWPALTQLPDEIRYFSALGGLESSMASTVPSGMRVKHSSELESSLLPVGDQVSVFGSSMAVLVSSIEP